MTPGARVAAAIEILDDVLTGTPAEQALTRWARRSRFAGSKDRAAVRDHVFDGLRQKRSAAALTGGTLESTQGRQIMIGVLRRADVDLDRIFNGVGHAPDALTDAEMGSIDVLDDASWDLPDWLVARFRAALGAEAKPQARALTERAPVTLRVNTLKTTRAALIADLTQAGYSVADNSLAETAVHVALPARGLIATKAYADGGFELQDAASQAAIAALDLAPGSTVLDACAGGGGKSLAFAARGVRVTAYDIDPKRMTDIPKRAARAGASIEVVHDLPSLGAARFDLVFVDAPCSGSGTWRRTPDAKWRLSETRLQELQDIQLQILCDTADLVAEAGVLAYATCSILREENEDTIERFLAQQPGWAVASSQRWPISAQGDGFFLTQLRRV